MWEQTLSGLIKALRSSKDDEKRVIQKALSEISQEVRSTDFDLKAGAILKLCYLDMLGYPQLSSYSFNVVECMSSNRFYIKQIGYLAASQSFGPNTEVSMLTTNLVKKDLVTHSNQPMSFLNLTNGSMNSTAPVLSLALSSLPNLLNSQNSTDLTPDLVTMLNHSKPTIRKRAVTAIHTLANEDMMRMIEEQGDLSHEQYNTSVDSLYNKSMGVWVERFREKLLDEDVGVVSSTVNVICELALKYPWPWLELAAELYDLLKLKSNNWMMIKIVKIFNSLTPIEPRLTKKLLPALSELISSTRAMSLLYECIHTVLASGMLTYANSLDESQKLAQVCIDKLANFLDHVDHNLRYMALVGLNKLVHSHPELLEGYLETILKLIHEVDPMLTNRALDLLEGIQYHPSTLTGTVDYLINHIEGHKKPSVSGSTGQSDAVRALMSIKSSFKLGHPSPSLSPSLKLRITNVIITICSKSAYAQISDFHWFLEVLVRLIRVSLSCQYQGIGLDSFSVANGSHAVTRLADTLIDVSSRVKDIKPLAVAKMLSLLHEDNFLANILSDCHSALEVGGSKLRSFDTNSEASMSASKIVTAAIWISGEYSDFDFVDLKDVISTLFKRQLTVDVSLRLPQISTAALQNGLKVFVKWLRATIGQWYSDAQFGAGYEEGSRFEGAHTSESPDHQSPQLTLRDAQLVQLRKLLSAISDRARELTLQKQFWLSSKFFVSIDHVQLLDRANEVDGMMTLLMKELVNFRPPTDRSLRMNDSISTNVNQTPFYGMSSFGEANPFAMGSDSSDHGGNIEGFALGGGNSSKTSWLLNDKSDPPYWYQMLLDLFFIYELKPVANAAQTMIQPPDELDLDSWVPFLKGTTAPAGAARSNFGITLDEFGRKTGEPFVNPYQPNSNNLQPYFDDLSSDQFFNHDSTKPPLKRSKKKTRHVDQETLDKAKKERIERQRADPFYIGTSTSRKPKKDKVDKPGKPMKQPRSNTDLLNIDSIPIVKLDLTVSEGGSPLTRESSNNPSNPSLKHSFKDLPSSSSISLASVRSPSQAPFIDVEGEVPDLSYLKRYPSLSKNRQESTSGLQEDGRNRVLSSPKNRATDQPGQIFEDNVVSPNPDSIIKVVKKKSSASKKKKKPQR